MNNFKNEITTTPFGEMPGSSATAAGDHKRSAIERWENEGGAIPQIFKPVSINSLEAEQAGTRLDWLARALMFQGGGLKSLETVVDGLDQAVSAFIGLFDGKNQGKTMV